MNKPNPDSDSVLVPMAPKTKRRAPARETKQERSRRTLERILVAAEELLQERDFHELTMVDLAKRAGCGVGTLYARVPNKESLVACLYERQGELAREVTGGLLEQYRDSDLEERARVVSALAVEQCAAHRGTIRATTEHLFRHPKGDVYGFRDEVTATIKAIAAFLAEKADHIAKADRQDACEFAVLAAIEVAQGRVVFGDRSGMKLRYSRKDLTKRITTLMIAYLRACSP